MAIGEKERLALRMDREIGLQMDTIIEKVIRLARKYELGEDETDNANSPFKNVLNVSVEPSSSLEVTKGFIRYQTGRKGASKIWKKEKFADSLVIALEGLRQDADSILTQIEKSEKEKAGNGEESSNALVKYITDNRPVIQRSLHLQLAQLYLGYLSREHIASKGGVPGQLEPEEENAAVNSVDKRPNQSKRNSPTPKKPSKKGRR